MIVIVTRSTTTEVTRDKNENILQTKQTERDE